MHELYPRQILPFETRNWYEKSLIGVIRFKDKAHPPLTPHFQENDFTHTVHTIDLARNFANINPDIAHYIGEEGLLDLEFMLYLHEAGEPLAGDMPINIQDLSTMQNRAGKFGRYLINKIPNDLEPATRYSLLREKLARREHKIFSAMVLPCFPEDLQPKIRELYFRFEELGDEDLVAQLANFFDKHDGNRTSLIHFMNKNTNQNYNPSVHDTIIASGLKRTLTYSKNIYKCFPPELKSLWIEYLEVQISIYGEYGYGELAQMHLSNFKDSLK